MLLNHCIPARALEVSGLFGDHMILQRERPVRVWGKAHPGEAIRVTIGSDSAQAEADDTGKWSLSLPPQPVGGPLQMRIEGSATLTINDILIGDIWLCAGQSNMGTGFMRREPLDPGDMDLNSIRYTEYLGAAGAPVDDIRLKWTVSSSNTVPKYPAFPWYFAQRIHQQTGIPIGIVKVNSGGARIEWFLNPEVVEPAKILQDWKYQLQNYERNLPKTVTALEAWLKSSRDARDKKLPSPLLPAVDAHPSFSPPNRFGPFCFYFGTISPLAKFPMKGVAWYQGESNVEDEGGYTPKLASLIRGWRQAWGEPSLPFFFVQLPNVYHSGGLPDKPTLWPLLREAQSKVLALPDTGMAVTIDVGDEDLHPRNKYDMARRLAAVALAKTYGVEIEYTAPIFKRAEVRGSSMVLFFDHLGGGLMVGTKSGLNPAREEAGGRLMEFAIAGQDRKFHTAQAVIQGDTVVVTSPSVSAPASVRYAYAWNPHKCNLYGRNGLPVAPFRTDNW